VRDRIVGEANSLSVEEPKKVLTGGQVAHGAIPKAPPRLNFTIELWVMAIGGCALRAGDSDYGVKKFAEKFRGVIRMNDVRRTATEVEFIQQTRYDGQALRSGRGIRITVFVKLSMRAKASVSPEVARPWPWKSIE
jgi:hypothetical protein